ncbi:SDR family NAD(P)-dependent oxidoreductase [Streptomyces sp. enrichment culture]|uniref:SDR family NAD(P)-dependent oxidoreductase n=1 Tax=Streptomyces sp. enrichment culture TaxID=1795815 RepID=UPI003F56DF41
MTRREEAERGGVDGKVVMITGASSGIGAAAARLFAEEGATVVLTARRATRLAAVAEEIRAGGGRALAVPGDVTRAEDVREVVRRTVDTYGRLDCAFNNAGWTPLGTLLHETDDDVFDRVVDVNVRGLWNCLKQQVPVMLETGGSIVNTASTAGVRAASAIAPYVAAKHAVVGLTKAVAKEYAPHRVRVNALVVGASRTELFETAVEQDPAAEERFAARIPLGRLADPREIAEAALWLCGERASFVTGAAVPVDGGRTVL